MAGGGRHIIGVSAVALLGILFANPSIAEQVHGHHRNHDSLRAAAKAHERAPQTSKPAEKSPADAVDTAVPLPSRSPLAPGRNGEASPKLKITKPEHIQPHPIAPSNRTVRNAIGQSVSLPTGPPLGGQHLGSPEAPNMQSGMNRAAAASRGLHGPDAGEANVHAASVPNFTNFEGAATVRPSPQSTGIGGPAKPVAEIGGAVLKPKR